MAAEKFNGRFLCHSSENFEEYLKECGFGYFLRKFAVYFSVIFDIKNKGNKWTIIQESMFKSISQEFETDSEYEETTADGRTFMTLVTFTPNGKLIQKQRKIKDTDKDCLITRFMEDDDTLVIVIEYGSVTAKRIFKRI